MKKCLVIKYVLVTFVLFNLSISHASSPQPNLKHNGNALVLSVDNLKAEIKQDGKLEYYLYPNLSGKDVQSKMFIKPTDVYDLGDYTQAANKIIQSNIKQVCALPVLPQTITLSLPVFSITWSTDKLCDKYKS